MSVDESGVFAVNAIQPLAGAKLTIKSAALTKPSITGGSISDMDKIQTSSLNVKNEVDIGGNVFVGGSMDVHGSVVGSGPYMDSSDARFKKNVEIIRGALAKVIALDGVLTNQYLYLFFRSLYQQLA